MRKVISLVLAHAVLFAGCAGREANPIAAYLPGDENRSCTALKAEVAQLQVDMARLLPKTDKGLTNALWATAGVFLIVPFFFMDFKDAERIEFDSMRRRHNRLLVYAAERNCDFGEVRAERIPSVEERKAELKKPKEESKEESLRPRPKKPDTDASGRKIQRYELKRDPSGEPAKDENGDLIIIPVYEDEPKSNEDYNERGIACAKKGEYDLAISEFTKAIETNPRDAVAYNNRGSAYKSKGEFEWAISDYNKAIEINPRLAEVYSNRAGAYYSKGEYDKAWEDVHQAQSLGYQVNPQSLKALREASGREK